MTTSRIDSFLDVKAVEIESAKMAVHMTLRDHFATMAMQAIRGCSNNGSLWTTTVIAEKAYLLADAMLEARKPT